MKLINPGEKIELSKLLRVKTLIAIILIGLGCIFNFLDFGANSKKYFSVGSWFIYIGFIMIILLAFLFLFKKDKVIDERNMYIANLSMRIAFSSYILLSFFIIILDSIYNLKYDLSQFLSFLLCLVIIIYSLTYKILDNRS